jgi:hypothetical protein
MATGLLLFRWFRAAGFFAALAIVPLPAASQAPVEDEELLEQRAEYAEETDPVDKAKILAKMGSREMTYVRNLLREGYDEKGLEILERYRDALRQTTDVLTAAGINAQRRPGGFKELQISLRQSIRRLDDLILSLQQDVRPWFRAVRSDMEATESVLIDALFPAPPVRQPRSASSQ